MLVVEMVLVKVVIMLVVLMERVIHSGGVYCPCDVRGGKRGRGGGIDDKILGQEVG